MGASVGMLSVACGSAGLRKVACGNWGRRSGIGIAAAFGLIVATPSAALASAGCTALRGSAVGGLISGNTSGTGFSAGDVITVSLTGFGAFTSIGLQNTTAGAVLITDAPVQGARTYTVPANTTATFTVIGGLTDPSPSYTWSCVSAAGSTGGNDSQKLTSVQTQGSTVVSSTSGSNISGSVNSAIDSSLSGTASTGGSSGTSSVTMSREEFAEQYASAQLHGVKPSGRDDRSLPASLVAGYYSKYDEGLALYDSMIAKGQVPVVDETARLGFKFVSATSLSFAEDRSPVARRADEAFASLGYVAFTKAPRKP